MLTEASLAANASNALHSTGPRTAEGKAISSQNANKHGLCSGRVDIKPGELADFEDLLHTHHAEIQPASLMERTLVDKFVQFLWKMRRIDFLETQHQAAHPELDGNPAGDAELEKLRRYYIAAERAFFRCLSELRALQTARALHGQWPAPLAKLSPANRTQSQVVPFETPDPRNDPSCQAAGEQARTEYFARMRNEPNSAKPRSMA